MALMIGLLLPLLALGTAENHALTVPNTIDGPSFSTDAGDILRVDYAPRGTELMSLTLSGLGCPFGSAYTSGGDDSLAVYTPRLIATGDLEERGR